MMTQASARNISRVRHVFCVVEQAYRNRLIADEVIEGRFTHIGITLELGLEPDWLSENLPADEEWRIEWSKFYYGLDLAYAFGHTGNNAYMHAWEKLVQSWIEQVPIGFDSSDVTGRRIQNWIYARNLFASASFFKGFSNNLEDRMIESIAAQANHLWHHLTHERNHRTLELYALLIVSLASPEIDTDGNLLDFAIEELHRNLMTDILPDGIHRENSTHYHMIALRSFLGARENARRFGLMLPDGFDVRLQRACEFAMHCHRPDGLIPALSDSDTGSYGDLLELASSIFERDDFLYAATRGKAGTPPRQLYKNFSEGGYFIQRSGWGKGDSSFGDERFMIFDCGRLGDGGHGHYDLLNVEIASYGRSIIIDPGRYTYSEQAPNWRRWFKGTAAHNTVCVDNLDQTAYHRGKPKGKTAQGRLIHRLSAPGFDILCGEAISPVYHAKHTRSVIFIANEYWVITDHLSSDRPHHFDLRFHLSPEAQNRIAIEYQNKNMVVRTPECFLIFCHPGNSIIDLKIEDGWYAPVYGIKHQAPVISLSVEAVSAAEFFTLIFPIKEYRHAPSFCVRVDETRSTHTLNLEIDHEGNNVLATDTVILSNSNKSFAIGSVNCRASAAWNRLSGGQSVITACDVREINHVSNNHQPLFKSDIPTRWITYSDQGVLQIDDGREL